MEIPIDIWESMINVTGRAIIRLQCPQVQKVNKPSSLYGLYHTNMFHKCVTKVPIIYRFFSKIIVSDTKPIVTEMPDATANFVFSIRRTATYREGQGI